MSSTTPFTDVLLAAFAPWLERDPGDLEASLRTLGGMFDTVAEITSDQGYAQDPTLVGWASDVSYGFGNFVEGSDGQIYSSLLTSNQGNDPATTTGFWELTSATPYVPAWATLLDPHQCPDEFLPYLGQFIGVTIQPGTDPVFARQQIFAECGFNRGTVSSIEWGARQNLTGNQSVTLIERTSPTGTVQTWNGTVGTWAVTSTNWSLLLDTTRDAYHFILIVKPSEIIDATLLATAVNARKPAGVQWTLVIVEGWTWFSASGTWASDTMTWAETTTTRP